MGPPQLPQFFNQLDSVHLEGASEGRCKLCRICASGKHLSACGAISFSLELSVSSGFRTWDLLRQLVYSRLAGYEDVNDAELLSLDPTFRLIGSEKLWDRGASLTSRLQAFETEMLAKEENVAVLNRQPSRRKNPARWDANECIFSIAGRTKRKFPFESSLLWLAGNRPPETIEKNPLLRKTYLQVLCISYTAALGSLKGEWHEQLVGNNSLRPCLECALR